MGKDILFLLVFLIVALAVLVWIQNQSCTAITNSGSLANPNYTEPYQNNTKSYPNNKQHFTTNKMVQPRQDLAKNGRIINQALTKKEDYVDNKRASLDNQKVTSRIIDNILKNQNNENTSNQELDSLIENDNSQSQSQFEMINPLGEDINTERNYYPDSDEEVLDELIKEVNTGNNLIVNNPKSDLYRSKSKSIDSAKKYRKVSYKDSKYRYDFNDNGDPTQQSQDELNSLYDDALIFKNNQYMTNGNYTGFTDTDEVYGNADLTAFTPSGPQSQQEKILSLYNSNEYLPNNNLLDKSLTKGFQILDNPVAVSNPNLIPVLKSIPVSSVSGSNRNATYDIRAEPPCPKTVVSPFLNSSIMPDIYSTQRGCL